MAETSPPAVQDGPEPDTCKVVDVPDVGPVRVRGSDEWTEEDRAMFAELIAAAKRRFIAERGDADA